MPAQVVKALRLAEKIDQVIPLMDQINGHAAAQRFAGAVDGAVIDAGAPVRQIGRAQHPRAVGPQRAQRRLDGQHRAAPAHRRGDIGFLAGFEQRGEVKAGLLGGKDRLFDEQRPGAPAHQGEGFGVQAGRVCDKRQVVPRQGRGVGKACELRGQALGRAGAQRARKVAAQRVGAQVQPALRAQRGQVVQVPRADGAEADEQGGEHMGSSPLFL